MALVNFENLPSENTPLTGGASGNLNVMQENGTTHGSDTKLGYSQAFLNDHLVNISNEVDEDYRVNFLKSKNILNYENISSTSLGNGITYSSSNGVITLNGTATSAGHIYFTTTNNYKIGTYTMSANILSGTFTGVIGKYIAIGTTNKFDGGTLTTNKTITTTEVIDNGILHIYIGNGAVCNNLQFTIMFNEGDTALPYEPYVMPSIVVDNEEIYSKIDYDIDLTDYKSSNVSTVARAMVHRTGKLYSFNCSVLVTSSGTNKQIFSQTPIKPDMTTNLMCINGNLQVSRAMIDINGNISIENAQTANIYYHLMGTIYVND